MSDYKAAYKAALDEYRRRVRLVALTVLPVLGLALWAQFKWSGSLGTVLLSLIAAGWAFGYQAWQRRLWRSLEIKHGLSNA